MRLYCLSTVFYFNHYLLIKNETPMTIKRQNNLQLE